MSSPPGPERGWRTTCRPSTPTRRRPRHATTNAPGSGPANCKSGSMKADSPVSAFPASTAAWVWITHTRRHSTTESLSYEMPLILNTPTFTICCATLLDTGSEDQKKQHIAAALRGDEILVQLLSEPSGGSDLAGVITRAERAGRPLGDQRRQDLEHQRVRRRLWTVPGPHRLGCAQARRSDHVPGADRSSGNHVAAYHHASGSTEFCEEFLDGVDVGDDAVVGEVNGGWAVASRQLYHERRAVGQGSEFASGSGSEGGTANPVDYVGLAEKTGQADNERVRRDGRPGAGAPRGGRAADRSRVPQCQRRRAAPGRRHAHHGSSTPRP